MKDVVECYKEFFGYFNALETNGLYHWIQCCNVHQYCSGTKQLQLNTLLVLKIELANLEILEKKHCEKKTGDLQILLHPT